MTSRNARFDFSAEVPGLETLGRVHLIAIGGSGMSAVARVMLARGVEVSGSDGRDSPVLETLRQLGARVVVGHDAANVAGAAALGIDAIRFTTPEALREALVARGLIGAGMGSA